MRIAKWEPENLDRWEHPRDYAGAEWHEYFSAGFGQSRDSDCLERSNFALVAAVMEKIGEPDDWPHDEAPWCVVRESHWAVGWVEWIAIHEDATDHLAEASRLVEMRDNYPVLDDQHFSEVEHEECESVWSECFNWRERVQYFRDHSHTVYDLPALLRAVRGDWYEAGNILHNPSDLIY